MLRIALYARYSSENQRDASIEDQLRQCRERAEREGWTVVETYCDRAISGSSMIRAGIQALLADAQARRFDIVLSEALGTVSAAIRKTWPPCSSACGSRAFPSSPCPKARSTSFINELHVGLKGTMNALFLKDLAMRVHRGQRGRVEAGKSGSGRAAYGYRVVHQIDANGETIRGERAIVEDEAERRRGLTSVSHQRNLRSHHVSLLGRTASGQQLQRSTLCSRECDCLCLTSPSHVVKSTCIPLLLKNILGMLY